jgi:hypothetical protein
MRKRSQVRQIALDRIAQIERDKGHRLWIGSQPDPADRLQIVVSQADLDLIPARGGYGTARVTDLLTGRLLTLERVECGAQGCRCALEEIAQPQFKIGDRVKAVAIPDGFPKPAKEVRGLIVASVTKHGGKTMPPYYRLQAEAIDRYQETISVEGAERFFEFEP